MTPTTSRPVTYGHDASIAQFSVARYQRMIEIGILTIPLVLDGQTVGSLTAADLLP